MSESESEPIAISRDPVRVAVRRTVVAIGIVALLVSSGAAKPSNSEAAGIPGLTFSGLPQLSPSERPARYSSVSARSLAWPAGTKVSQRQADTSFSDAAGDAQGGGPDVEQVAVVNDADGNIAIGVFYTSDVCAAGNQNVLVWIDADQNPATGGGQPGNGAEYLLVTDPPRGFRGVVRWNGTTFQAMSVPSLQAGCHLSGYDYWVFSRHDLGIGAGFNLAVITYPDPTSPGSDFAPNSLPYWNYQLSSTAPPPSPSPAPSPTPKPPKPVPAARTIDDASRLPSRIRYVGNSIKHVRLGEKLYSTMKQLGAPRVVNIACWSNEDWPSVLESAEIQGRPSQLSGFWHSDQPRWVHLQPKQCSDVQALMLDRQPNGQRAYALSTVLHERIHAQGIFNEAQTECYANQLVYEFARELNFVHTKALRLGQLAVRKSNSVFRGTKYSNPKKCRDGGDWDLYSEFRNLDY